ncbi:MAG TPA: hypothetical protein DFI01_07475 [Bacteroidales bacterium]|nr:hypothetical protein [Bacteroidales bacterium]
MKGRFKNLSLLLAIMLIFGSVFSGVAFAASVTPVYNGGNDNKLELEGPRGILTRFSPLDGKWNDLGEGNSNTFYDDDFEVTVTVTESNGSDDIEISFSANKLVYYVSVKASNGYNLYHYEDGTLSDTGLKSVIKDDNGGYHGISHMSFFYHPDYTPPEEWEGSIRVTKVIEGEDEPNLAGFTIELWKDGELIYSGETDVNGKVTFSSLAAGTYTIEENLGDQADEYEVEIEDDGEVVLTEVNEYDDIYDITVTNTKIPDEPEYDPSIDVEKYVWDGEEWQDADSAPGPDLLSGNNVQFKFVVKNTGNVDLEDIKLEDSVFDLSEEIAAYSLQDVNENTFRTIDFLAANDGAEGGNDEYVLEFEAPWAEGQHTNKATVSVYYNDILNSDEDDANYFGKVPQVFEYELSITKKADVDEYDKVGDIINYTIKVKNTGNTKLTGVTVSDPMLKNLTGPTEVVSEAGVLDVNEEWTYTGSYTIVQGDIKTDGFVKNVATADSNETGPETASVTVHYDKPSPPPENKRYRMTIDKKADVKEYSAAGDEIVYTITLKNTGNTALSDVEVTDPMLGVLTGPEGDDNNNNKLDLRETWVYEGIYIVTEADMEKDSITNTAKAESSRTDAVEDTAVVEKVEEILDEDTALGVPEVVVEDPEVPLALPDTGAFMNTSILAAIGSAFVLSGIGLGRKKRN